MSPNSDSPNSDNSESLAHRLGRRAAIWHLEHAFDDLTLLVGLAITVLAVLTFDDYGITWDEEFQNVYGVKLLHYYSSFFQDRSAFEYINLYLYGGLFDLAAAVANKFSPIGEYETRHLLNGLVGILGLVGCARVARLMGGPRAGFLALLLLALTPPYYGQMFNNPKDVPFAVGMTWVLYYSCRIVSELPRPKPRTVFRFGIVLGLALGVRVGAVLGGFYFGLAMLGWLLLLKLDGMEIKAAGATLWGAIKRLLPALPVAYAVMVVFWPWAAQAPLNPLRALHTFSSFPWKGQILLGGQLVKSTDLPAIYLPQYLAVKLPELVLLGLLVAGIYGLRLLARWREAGPAGRLRQVQLLLLLLAAFFPILYFVGFRPVAYNGIRHFLFGVPPLAVLAAIGLDRLWRDIRERGHLIDRTFALCFMTAVVVQTWIMGGLHPDEYIYYNVLIGGVKGAENEYELDYWGNSLAEATKALTDFVEMEHDEKPVRDTYKVMVCGYPLSAAYYLPPYMKLTGNPKEADFFISLTLSHCDRTQKGKEIVRIERFDSLLSVVKDRRYITHPPHHDTSPPPEPSGNSGSR